MFPLFFRKMFPLFFRPFPGWFQNKAGKTPPEKESTHFPEKERNLLSFRARSGSREIWKPDSDPGKNTGSGFETFLLITKTTSQNIFCINQIKLFRFLKKNMSRKKSGELLSHWYWAWLGKRYKNHLKKRPTWFSITLFSIMSCNNEIINYWL